ncbi:hypothetical protein STRIP9103_00412 [Streptomyces ipomoeae 91-03]|uniref:Uncharacterized protein n=1 Tax=Streptomyces ipomoeae 91-03 TaxID=698759 RepID=L1KT83_9ACTN|nr:hypothetical protein STRIP9103_00412 [Streptomyces ipomoeae 91-03]
MLAGPAVPGLADVLPDPHGDQRLQSGLETGRGAVDSTPGARSGTRARRSTC